MKDLTLVILAAGMGSRFGGLKQIEPVGPNGEFIIDYSVYDAIEAGFNKLVFVIRKENYNDFRDTIGKRIEKHIDVSYAFQSNEKLPDGYKIPDDRVKPLGTAHAFYCMKDMVKGPFVMINADDFYGKDAFIKAAEFLKEEHNGPVNQYGFIGYLVKNTITEYGAVKRGVCEVEGDTLLKLTESNVERINGKIVAKPLDGGPQFDVDDNQTVSMNMLLFDSSIFEYIDKKFPLWLDKNKDNMDKAEYLIPDVLFNSVEDNYATVKVIKTTATWSGVTYREDLDNLKLFISKLISQGDYNENLW